MNVQWPQPIRIQISANVLPKAPNPAKTPLKFALLESIAEISLACEAFIEERISTGNSGIFCHSVLTASPSKRTRCHIPFSFFGANNSNEHASSNKDVCAIYPITSIRSIAPFLRRGTQSRINSPSPFSDVGRMPSADIASKTVSVMCG